MKQAEQCVAHLFSIREDLRHLLEPVWEDTKACTRVLTAAIENVCRAFGATVQRELHLSPRIGLPGHGGFLDLVALFADGSQLAVEVDTTQKAWSVAKLARYKAAQPEAAVLWVRWADYTGEGLEEAGVPVLGLPDTTSTPGIPRYRGPEKLKHWLRRTFRTSDTPPGETLRPALVKTTQACDGRQFRLTRSGGFYWGSQAVQIQDERVYRRVRDLITSEQLFSLRELFLLLAEPSNGSQGDT